MLALLKEMVTFTVSSFNASSSGEGRKSATLLTFPIGSSVYLIFSFINFPPFSPVPCANDPNLVFPVSEPNSHYASGHLAQAVKPFFLTAVLKVFKDDTILVEEGKLSQGKGNTMLFLVLLILLRSPFKIRLFFHA